MFDTTNLDGAPVLLRASFWQCVKAGIGFTVGAGIVGLIAGVVYYWVLFATLAAILR